MHSDTAIAELGLKGAGNGGNGASFDGSESGPPDEADIPRRAYVTATLIALAGILMFFAAFVSASVVRKGSPSGDWRQLVIPRILWLNTTVLLASSFSLTHARRSFLQHKEEEFHHWWRISTILGAFFVAGQLIAWRQLASSGIYLATNPASSFFYILTAAHGLHVAVGIAALLVVGFGKPTRIPFRTAVDVIGMYWHFMDAVWIFLFFFLLTA